MDERQLAQEVMLLRLRQRDAIRREDWAYYWLCQHDKMAICRKYLPTLFFSGVRNVG